MGGHVRNLSLRHLPIPAIGVPPAAVLGLPAVVHDDAPHSQGRRLGALRLDLPGDGGLVEAVPAGVHGLLGLWRHGARRQPARLLPPAAHRAQRLGEADVLLVAVQGQAVLVRAGGGVQGHLHPAVQPSVLLPHAQAAVEQRLGVAERHGQPVSSLGVVEAEHRRGGGHLRGQGRGPVHPQRPVKAAAGVPRKLHVHQRLGPGQRQLGRPPLLAPLPAQDELQMAVLVLPRVQLPAHIGLQAHVLPCTHHTIPNSLPLQLRPAAGALPPHFTTPSQKRPSGAPYGTPTRFCFIRIVLLS